MQIRSRTVASEFKSEDRPGLYAGIPPLEALNALISIAARIMHIDTSRAYFHAEAQRLVLVRLPVDDRISADAGKQGLGRSKQSGRAHPKLGILTGTQLEESLSSRGAPSFRNDTW